MGFVSQGILRRALTQRPCPLGIIYWAAHRVTAREALLLLTPLEGSARLLLLGRFAYIEAPPPGQQERRQDRPTSAAITSLRLADLLTDAVYSAELERRVLEALDPASSSTPSTVLLTRTLLPQRTLEAMCCALEEKGVLQVVLRDGSDDVEPGGDFMVLRPGHAVTA